jgi:hypothetical protein
MASRKSVKAIKEEIRLLRIKLEELLELYRTHLYLETMPVYDPLYKYCYVTSNFTLKYEDQSVDAWLRAIAIHMSRRHVGHGGGYSDAVIITPPRFTSENARDNWIEYRAERLRKKVRVKKPIVKKPKYKRGTATKLN